MSNKVKKSASPHPKLDLGKRFDPGTRDRMLLKPVSGLSLAEDLALLDTALGLGLCCLSPDEFNAFEAIINKVELRHHGRTYDRQRKRERSCKLPPVQITALCLLAPEGRIISDGGSAYTIKDGARYFVQGSSRFLHPTLQGLFNKGLADWKDWSPELPFMYLCITDAGREMVKKLESKL